MLTALALGLALVVAADERAVEGVVKDAVTGVPLVSARVSADGREAATDGSGRFRLSLAEGPGRLTVSAPGYDDAVVLVDPASAEVQVALTPRARFREQVDVTAAPAPDQPAVLPLRPRQVLTVAGAADNVFRVLQTLPGVAATEEFGSRLSVRGGTPDQNLTVMDGVEIHNPYRLFGLTSAFNPETVERFELTAGGFGAKYGDRLSSLLVVENRAGARDRGFTGSSALSVTDANVVAEGPLPGRAAGSWLLTARRTYYDLVAERFVDTDLPSFNDVQGSLRREMGGGRWLSLSGIRSREDTDATFDDDETQERGDFVTRARNDLASARFHAPLGGRLASDTVAAWYRNTDLLDVDALFQNTSQRTNAPGDNAYGLADVVFDRTIAVRDLSLRQSLAAQAGRHTVESGFELHRLSTRVALAISGDRNPSEGNGSSVRGGAGLPDALDSSLDSTRGGAWLQDRVQISGDLAFEPGLRLDWSDVNRRATLAPRLAASLRLDAATRLRAAGGLFTQSPGYEKLIQSDYLIDLSGGRPLDLDSERAVHAILGLERDLVPGALLRVEAYWKRFSRLIVGGLETEDERLARVARYDFPSFYADSIPAAPIVTSRATNDGRGRAYGFDVYAARNAPDARLTGWASYTYGRAERTSYGRTYPLEYDRRHAGTVVASWRAGARLDVSLTGRFASGFPRTPVVGLRVAAAEDARDFDRDGDRSELVPKRDPQGRLFWETDLGGVANLSSARLPVFARVDLRATWRPRGTAGRWQLYLDVINLLNRQNAGLIEPSLFYDPGSDRPRLEEHSSAGIPFLPSVGVRFRF
jgi:TonB-dependent receptor-like protein/carboxypeptidase family protein